MKLFKRNWLSKYMKVFLSVAIIWFMISVPYATVSMAMGPIYYVATDGDDSNSGTSLSAPFQTIQKAASVAQAGDIVYIRGGTYRETITPANSGSAGNPIRFQNYNNETVVVSGADLVTGWTLDSGFIYKVPMDWSLGAGNQVFVNGGMMDEARWPNQTGTLINPTRATAGTGTDLTHIVDSNLPGADGFWNGATLWTTSGHAWIAMTSTITGYDSAAKKLTFEPLNVTRSYYVPKAGNRYYLSGIIEALDTEKEWWYDPEGSMLYLWAPEGGNPANHTVEAKKRNVAFDLAGKAYVEIDGIQTFAATITMDSQTNNCLLQGITGKYISHNKLNTAANEQSNLGIILDGSYNEIRNSELAYSSGSLVTVKGSFNNVINSYIHDGGYVPNWEGVVNLQGANSLISHNTVRDAGRVTIFFNPEIRANQIQYNNIYNAGWLTTDLGMIYGPNTDGQNTVIHHNHVHDTKSVNLGIGIYLDNFTNNFIIHHNATWNNLGLQLNIPSNYNLVYNNTSWTSAGVVNAWGNTFLTDMHGVRIFNNIIRGYDPEIAAYTNYGSNLLSSPGFVDEASHNYRLQPSSNAIDAGIMIPGVTDGYTGSAPDIGAYEYGGTDWIPGHNFTSPPNPTYSQPDTPFMNRVSNGGFEHGDLSAWAKTDIGNAIVVNDNHWGKAENEGMSRSGLYGLKLSGGVDGVEQTVTGLQQNTRYTVGGWLRTPAGETATLGVNNYGGAELSASSNSSTWTFKTIDFVTGISDTSATIYFKKTSATGEAYVDDAGLVFKSVLQSPLTIEAENYSSMNGVSTGPTEIGSCDNGDWVKYSQVNLGSGYSVFTANVGVPDTYAGQNAEVRLDSPTGTLAGTLTIQSTGGFSIFTEQSTSLAGANGMHDVYIVFKGAWGVGNFDWFKFSN